MRNYTMLKCTANRLTTLLVLLLFLGLKSAYAQDLSVTITVPLTGEDRFSICGGERLMTVRVENTTGAGGGTAVTLFSIVSTLNLTGAAGIKFTGTLTTITKSSGLADVTVNNASTPSFNIPDLSYTEFVEFKVGLSSDCGSLPLVKSGTKPTIPVNFAYTGGTGAYTKTSLPFEILKPSLSIPKVTGNFDPTSNTLDAGAGVTDSLTVQVTNAGSGILTEFIYWVKDHPQLTLQNIKVGNVIVPAMGTSGDTTFFKITTAMLAQAFQGTGSPTNNMGTFQFNESLNIKEIWYVDDCKLPAADIQHGVRYGCDNSLFPKCEEAVKNTGVRFGLLRPVLVNDWYYGFGDPYPGCGIAIAGQYLTNTGRVKATEINFDLKFWVPEYPGTGSLDLDNMYVQKKSKATGILGPLTKVTASSLIEAVSNGCSPSTTTYRGAAIKLTSAFDLLPGDTLFVKWQQLPECQQACNPAACEITANNYALFGHAGISTSNYTDPCKLQTYLITYRYQGSLYSRMPYFAEAPSTIDGGQIGTYTMTLTDFNIWKYTNHGSTRTDAQGNKNISSYPRRRIQFIYTNDIGLDWNRGATDFTWTDNQGDKWTPTSVRYIDHQTDSGDTLIVTYTGNWPANFNPAASNTIKVNYLADCSEVPVCTRSKVANISSIIRFMADSTCTDCAGSIGDVIGCKSSTSLTVRCPTCDPCAGLTPISFNIERTNFEFPDNTNDYRPDASGAINKNMVALNRAIAGDTVVAKYKGVFGTSVNHTQWENAYNLLQLPSGLGLTFTPIGGSLKIVDTDGVGATIGTYTSNILQQYPSGNDVITNISPSNVASLSTTDIPASFTSYGNGDTVYVEVKLVVADNTFNRNNDGNVFKSVDVGDASFASHVSIAQTNKPNIGTNIPNTEYKDRYQCDVVTSRFYYIEMYHNLESGDNSYPGGCTEGNMGYDWEGMFIGVRTVDYFPFEYRTPKGNVTVSKFVKRSDFIYTKVEWQIYAKDYIGRPYKVGDVPLNSGNYGSTLGATTTAVHYGVLPMDSPYVQVVGDTVYTYIDKFLKDNFGSIVADEGYRVFTRPYYVASCATVKSGQNAIRHYPYYNFKLDDKVFGYSALNNVSRYTFYPTDVTYYGKPYATLGYGYAGGPNLILQTSSAQQDLIGSEACFQVDIINTTDYVANNTWATFTNSSGSIQIKSIKEINPSTGAVINTPTKVLGIYQLGNTAAASSGGVPKVRRFEICVYSDNCNRDSIKVNTGWDCLGYPKTVEEAACNAPVYLYTNPIKAELDMIIKEPIADVTAQLCNEQEYIVQLSSAILGTLNNINLQYEMPSGMTMVPGSFQYLYPSPVSGNPLDAAASAWVTAPNQPSNTFGTTYLVNVTDQGHPILSTTGLVGTTDIGKNLMFVKFKVKTECNYMSGSPINFLSWAYDACDKLTNYRFSPSKKLLIQGAPDIYRTEITVDPTSLNPCKGEKKTISAGFSILPGSVATTGDDSVRVLLPPGMAYSQMISMNAAHMNGPTTKIENGQQIIYWKINPGLTGGTSVNWSFEITSSDAAQTCNKPYEIVVQTFRSSSAACNGVTCSIRVLSDEARGNVSFIKPNLSIVSFGASSKAMPPSQEEVTYNIKIQNDGEAIPAGTVTKIEVYSDNGNGDVGTGDVLLFTATTTDAIPSGGVAILSGSALVSAGTTCSLIAMVNPLTTCTCSRIESFVIHPTLDVPFSPRQMFACSNTTTATFGPPVLTNHTYEWIAINGANLTALSSKTSSPITFKLRNTGTTNQTHTYVLRTMRNNDCYVFDTLSVTVYPEIADSTTFTVCKNADFKLAGPSNGTAFLWTPTTSLSSATDPQATVVGGVAAISRYTLNYLDANGCPAVYIAKINITDCGATALGDTVWYDKNANGLQEVAEPGIEGIVVYLYAGSNTSVPISSTTTNSAGYYLFNNLPQGYYSVGFVLPNGGVFTTKDAGSNTNDTKDSDADPVTGLAPQVFISNGVKYPDYDAGIVYYEYGDAPNTYKTSSASGGAKHLIVDGLKLGNLIDGDADAHSPAVTGSNAIGDDTADGNDDEDGITSFDVLNTLTTTYTVAVNATNTTALAANLVGWIDFNRNGTFETTEGVSVAVPTGTTNGIFNLTYTIPSNILGGLTYARFRLSSDAALTTATPAGTVNSGEVEDYELTIITLKDWGDNPDSYQTDAVGVSGPSHKIVKSLFLGTLVDDETDGIPAAAGANSTGDDLNKASNDEDGVTFPVITPGATSYSATIKATNTGSTAAKVVGWIDFNNNTTYQTNESATVSVPAGTNNGTFTLNFTVPNTAVLTVNELLYARFRLTSDATITSATPGGEAVDGEVEDYDFIVSPCIKPSAGKDTIICDPKSTIKLKAANSTELWYAAASNPAVASITANGDVTGMTVNGDYQFILQYSSGCTDTVIVTRTNVLPNVGAGTTKVINCTNPQVQLDGTSTTPNVSYLWTTTDGTIVSGATTLTPTISAAGTYKLTVTSLISGCSSNASVTITGDANLPNAGPDVERVCTGGGNVLYATLQGQPIVSAGGGEWQYVSGPAGGTLNFNDIHSPTSGVNTTTPGTYVYKWVNLTNLCADQVNIDMPSCYGSIGDYVWFDANADGIQDAAEMPIAGIAVHLLKNGVVVRDTTTDANGLYLFDKVLSGTYQVKFDAPIGYNGFSKQNATADDAKDNDINDSGLSQFVVVDATKLDTDTLRNNPNVDAGLIRYGSIGNYVWFDANADGIQDATETPIQGVTVNLLNASGAILQTTTTSATGLYEFDSLLSNTYKIQIVAPVGYNGFADADKGGDDTKDSDFTDAGMSPNIIIDVTKTDADVLRNNPTIDAGLIRYGSIGNYVWFDANANGIQDATETPIAGVTVNLLNASGTILQTTTTSATGLYEFDSLLSNTYKIQIVVPTGYNGFADADKGGDDTKDSDFTDAGMSPNIIIDVTKTDADILRNNPTIDAGLIRYGSIGNYVWFDANADGIQDATETPIAGVTVNLLNASGTILQTTTTSATGLYEFDSLLSNTYKIQIVVPTGYNGFADADKGGDDTKDSDFTDAGMSPNIVIDVTKTDADVLRNNPTIDAGLIRYGSIGNYVWFDANADGIQDATETPIAGVTVNLLNSSGTILQTTTTSATGLYEFDSLLSNTYKIQIVAPVGYNGFADADKGGDDTKDSDFTDAGMGPNIIIDVTKTDADVLRNNPTIDAGLIRYGSIGNYVWFDANADGIQDATETPIQGVTVNLLNASGVILQTTTTSTTGLYEFDSLLSNTYKIQIVAPVGYNGFADADKGGDDTKDSDFTDAGMSPNITIDVTKTDADVLRNNPTIDAGLIRYGSIGNYVWFDANADGIQDATEAPIAGVTVNLLNASGVILQTTTTSATGLYEFDSLLSNTYKIQIVAPVGYNGFADADKGGDDTKDSDFTDAGMGPNIIIDVTKTDADVLRNNPTIDAGLIRYGSIGNYVWFDANADGIQDAGEAAVQGAGVYLLTSAGILVQNMLTDAAGHYEFDSLLAGNYKVRIFPPAGYNGFTEANSSVDDKDSDFANDGYSPIITIDITKDTTDLLRNNPTIDAGLLKYGTIGNYVWFDANANGVQDISESGIQGITVNLLNASGTILQTTLTSASGLYEFDSLLTGNYQVQIIAPVGYNGFTDVDKGGDDNKDNDFGDAGLSSMIPIDISKDATHILKNNPTIDAGLVRYGSIGNYVWFDANANGVQDAAESPLQGITVNLLDASGAVLQTTTTSATGLYEFDSLLSNTYKVQVIAPVGYNGFADADKGGDDTKDSDFTDAGMSPNITIDVTKTDADILRNNPTIDAGLIRYGSIGNYVWFDANADGVQDVSELGVQGVVVNLLDASGAILQTTTTSATGLYEFDSLLSNTYKIQIVAPVGYNGFADADKGGDDTKDSDFTDAGMSPNIIIDVTKTDADILRNNLSIDAGLIRYGSIGNYVWFDVNANGIQDATETPIAGVTVNLLNASGTILQTSTTSATGLYEFDSLLSSTYQVQIIAPTGYNGFADIDKGGDDTKDSDFTDAGMSPNITIDVTKTDADILRNNPTIDAGLIRYGSIGNYVWLDGNVNGIQDATESPIVGMTVQLLNSSGVVIQTVLTSNTGFYEFDSLISGNYQVKFVQPADYNGFTITQAGGDATKDNDISNTGISASITIDVTKDATDILRNNPTIDAGLIRYGSIGNYVWFDENANGVQDATETPLANITVNLYDASNNIIQTTKTNASGLYVFDTLATGNYKVGIVLPTGYDGLADVNKIADDTKDNDFDDLGFSPVISIDVSKIQTDILRNNLTVDAGLIRYGSLGNYVWFDENGDGIQNATEKPIAGVTVNLLYAAGGVVQTTTTDAAGHYSFDSLTTNNYRVQIIAPLEYSGFTKANAIGDDAQDSDFDVASLSHIITLDASKDANDILRNNPTIDAGLIRIGSIGNYVWYDENANGIQESTETPVANVTVNLLDNAGNILKTTITNSNGFYLFDSLLTNSYRVQVVTPANYDGFTTTNLGANDTKDSDFGKTGLSHLINLDTSKEIADTLRNNPNIDAGLVRFGSIGNYVWFDSNKDGIQASTETPVPNLTVYLLNSAGQIIESTLTDASGLYKFDSLLSGNYFVKFALSSNYDGFTTANLGGDDTKDSDADANGMSPVIVINTKGLAGSPERDNTSIDAGLLSIGSLGDYVWYDKNGNGVQETGEPPIAGVEVELLNSGGTVIATTTTDVNGFYLFGKLVSGTYQVRFIEPTGYNGFTAANKGTNDKLDSDVTPSGLSHLITIDITKTDTLRNNPQVDAGLLKFGSLGDFVWFDKNADGIQDIAEVGVPNMTIYLLDASGNKLDSTQTDANGKYLFDSLSAGTYKVQFIEPTGYDGFTKKDNTATTEATDSVVNTLGITDAIIIDPSYPATNFLRNNTRIDAGLVKYGSIGNVVWFDKNRDGIQDAGEPPITGVKVNLYDKNGTLISSILTDANGYYEFDSLLAGEYRIEFEKPAGYDAFTSPNAGSNDGIDSDPNELGLVPNILIDTDLPKGSTGRDNFTIYAGLIVGYGSIGNYVWIDDNHDGIQDATEVGVEGVRVYLLNASGNKIDSTLTDNTGKYLFDKLESGSYKVQFKLPLGYDRFTDANKPSDDAKDSDVNAAGLSQNITIDTSKPQTDTLRNNPNIDAGLILSFGQIGDLVWFDKNGDGIQNIDEIPVVGVKVYLLNALGVKIDSAVTDSSGKYLFDGLLTGNYRVQFSLPTGYDSFSASNKGTDDAKDSDVTSTGLSHLIKIDTSKPMSDTLRSNLNIDAGLLRYGSIGNYVWLDANANGVQDATESPIAAVKVYLLNAGGNIIDSTITNNAGYYSFEKLLYGNYQVKFIQPIGYEGFTKANAANDDTKDSDINASGLSHNILIDTSKPLGDTLRNNPNIDAGLVRFGSISNFVWFDVNGNGIQDNTEKGVAGITVKLLDQNGNVIATTLTDATGNYLFDSLASGNYRVKIDVPSTFDGVSKQNAGTNDAFDNDFNSTGLSHLITIDTSKPESDTLRNNPNIDAGLVKFGSIGDYVWLDVNKDGTQAATELPVANIRVFLLDVNKNKIDTTNTDNNGEYLFDKLVSGTYYVSFDVPTGYNITKANVGDDTKDSDANASGLSHAITIDVTKALSDTLRTNPNIDLGLIAIGSLGNYVWYDLDKDGRQDSGEPAVSGIKVYLLNASGIKIDSAITDASGKYSFYNLESGQYRVKFEVPKGTITTLSNAVEDTDDSDVDGSGLTSLITIDTSQPIINLQRNNPTIDMGLIAVGSIGDYVWFDTDKDGTQDAAETGLAGVTVNLLDAEGKVIVSTTTDANGKYLFSNLSSGTYQVQFVAPSGKVFTQANLAGDNIDSDANTDGKTGLIVIDATKPLGSPLRDNKDVDAGFINQVIPYGSIGDLVWSDKDADGIQDANETGVANVKVYLLDANGKKIDSTLTDQFGKYLFDSLINGNYQVQFVLPNGTSFSPANATNDTQDSDAGIGGKSPIITINTSLPVGDAGRNNLTVDAGLIPPYGSIGDYVFLDNDDSKTQTTADTPVAGIKVYLLNAAGNKIDSTITNASGLYKFDSLLSGLYSVQFVAPNGKTFITKDTGTDDKDSDADSNGKTGTYFVDTNKPAGDPTRDITSVDAGFAPEKPILYGSIGDRVWNDTNSNGTQDGAETGVPNVKVYLLNALGVKIDSTITDANGKYLFDSLLAGTYSVQFITPSGKNFTNGNIGNDATDSDADATGKTSAVTVDTSKPLGDSARNITSVDAGLVTPYGSIGDKVWNDTNRDGIQDATETGVPNVKVYLLNASGVKIDSTITDANGKYVFDSLTSGTYSVQFVAPSGNQFTNANIGNDATDSDADAIGKTAPITLDTSKPVGDPARNITSVDAGLVKEIISYGSIGDKVWNDTNRDGVQDANEVGVANVKVYLLNASGVKIDSTITDANGKYLFDSLVTGSYSVQFVAPTGNNFTLANSTGDTIDSDVDATGKTAAISINTSFPIGDTRRDNRDTDAGLVKPLIPYGSIGDRVWDDTNRDGVQDANEVGVANVKVYLLSASGVKIDSTITDANGKYLFDSLTSGTYSVQFVAPTGTNFTVANSTGDTVDSDADATGKTSPITLDTSKPVGDPARNITSVDAGLVKPLIPYGSIGDKVWNDTNKDGVQDANEIGVLNVKVYLLNANGVRIDSTITDVNGKYLFDSLVTGTYSVQFVSPAGMAFTLANSTGDSIDSDAGTDGKTSSISINTSYPAGDTRRDNRDSDAGLVGVIPKVFDLALTKKLAQGQSATLKAGNLVKFTLTVINQGNVDATNIQISDNVPAGLTLADSNWTLNGSKATMKTPIVLLAAGQLTARDIVFKVGSVTGSITNIAEISSATGGTDKDSTPDDNFTNDGTPKNDEINENGKTGGDEDDSDIETITVIPEIITKAKVHVLKTVNQNVINVGDVVTYTISVWNDGNKDTTGVEVTEALYAGAAYVSSTANNGFYNAATKIWKIGNLIAKGDTAKLTVKVKVVSSGIWFNSAIIKDAEKADSSTVCVSTLLRLCSERNESIVLTSNETYSTYQWYKDNQLIVGANSKIYTAKAAGSYTVRPIGVAPSTCPSGTCCPIVVVDVCECKAEVCIPMSIKKIK